ncbi:MAG: ArnT family glycosyltransferase [Planctomycetota bacterium]
MVAAAWGWFSWNADWQSDDFIALHYTQSWGNTFSDFWGAQYGLPAVAYFYRPLVTFSWALDGLFGGTDPLVSHLHNVILHGVNATLVALVVHRLMNRGAAVSCLAGLIWGLAPAHAGVVAWAAGRTGIYCTFFVLMSLWFMLRWLDARQDTRLLSFLFFVLALCSKELAIALPGIVMVVGFCVADKGYRLRAAWRHSWPYLVVLALYLWWRYLLFGGIGGYESGTVNLGSALVGLGTWLAWMLNPLLYSGYDFLAHHTENQELSWTCWLGFLAAAIAVFLMFKGKDKGRLAGLGILFLVCALPSYQLWPNTDNLRELRLFYLPGIAVAALLAYGTWRTAVLALLTLPLPFLQLQEEYAANWHAMRVQHQELLRSAGEDTDFDTIFVYGLARENDAHTAVAFHLGVDRLVQPPFDGAKHCLALRPLLPGPGVHQLPYGDVHGVPFERTYSFVRPSILAGLGRPPIAGLGLAYMGPGELTLDVLEQMWKGELDPEPQVQILGRRAERYRVTVFTAGGYLTVFVTDESFDDAVDGLFTIKNLLLASHRKNGGRGELAWALRVPTAVDIDPVFPVLVELDVHDRGSESRPFDPTHANQAPIHLRLDRRYATIFTPQGQ